ncbi:vitamin B12 ABC transporter substrate-binding protein BtuF [Erwiniaceae bacterium BAC15a-03b]|uniref:Vitamin B12-binding protein n=1 Tax=Winslowiella arboricola TaxID=2978220 RepID=A0A9J6PHX3_9GAMM|nr:vitamin B12 ABC transporter substrate-binding protein BtuF [Winslowiella arboricola]MCU5771567.1 vitamin B12 ABC transporter substrate-binding protein BtuF [Winslowiella arboricola]MCU5776302.1 vitamin B12 ABC transporter substrate-binding protein BtuF [Winslowiella arboricola]
MAKFFAVLLLLLTLPGVTLAATAPRVITLAPHLTELAFAAGITPVAVSAYSDYPPQATKLEQVANWQGIKVERILALKPDVVLAWRGGTPQRQVEQLQALGLKIVWMDAQSIESVVDGLRELQAWSPQPRLARQHADELALRFATLRQRYQHPQRRPVFLQFGMQPLFTASQATLQNQILQLCGGDNIFADSKVPWPQVSREQVLMRHPQAIVITGAATRIPAVIHFWQPQLAVPVIAINDDWFSRAGPRIIQAAEQLCSMLQPNK